MKKVNFAKYQTKLKRNNIVLLGNQIHDGIMKRTQSGLDANLKPFKPYSKQYAKYKSEKYGSTVNLTQYDHMLAAITHKKIPNGIRMYFNSNEQTKKAYYNQVTLKRFFFYIDRKQKDMIKKFLEKSLLK